MWVYRQDTGKGHLQTAGGADSWAWQGYSGFGAEGKNQPLAQSRAGIGPIPIGAYYVGQESESPDHGPIALHLIPLNGTNVYGRSGFLCHGDSRAEPGAASHGCIIAPPEVRIHMRDGYDKLLVVLSGAV